MVWISILYAYKASMQDNRSETYRENIHNGVQFN